MADEVIGRLCLVRPSWAGVRRLRRRSRDRNVHTELSPEVNSIRSELNHIKDAVHLLVSIMPYVDPAGTLRPGISPLSEYVTRQYSWRSQPVREIEEYHRGAQWTPS